MGLCETLLWITVASVTSTFFTPLATIVPSFVIRMLLALDSVVFTTPAFFEAPSDAMMLPYYSLICEYELAGRSGPEVSFSGADSIDVKIPERPEAVVSAVSAVSSLLFQIGGRRSRHLNRHTQTACEIISRTS